MRNGHEIARLIEPGRVHRSVYTDPELFELEMERIAPDPPDEAVLLVFPLSLVRIAGRDDSLGRPVLYGTTKKFLQMFGLRGLKDLPRADDFRTMNKADAR